MQIKSKTEFLQLYMKGVLGNRFALYQTAREALNAGEDSVGFRELSKGGGKFQMATRTEMLDVERQWKLEGRKFYLNAGDYDIQRKATIQGELCRTFRGWHSYTGPANVYKMRDMFAQKLAVPKNGLATRLLMKHYMDANTLEDVDELLDMYPNATIEFTSYSIDVGILPRRNTIIWEVRDY